MDATMSAANGYPFSQREARPPLSAADVVYIVEYLHSDDTWRVASVYRDQRRAEYEAARTHRDGCLRRVQAWVVRP